MSTPNAPVPGSPDPLDRRIDRRRIDHDVFHAQEDILHAVGGFNAAARTLLSPHGRGNFERLQAQETRLLTESGHDDPTLQREAELSAMLATSDPVRVRNAFIREIFAARPFTNIRVPGTPVTFLDANINYNTHQFWTSQHTAQEIFDAIFGRDVAQLGLLGITTTPPFPALPEAQARALAEVLSIPYMRAGDSGVSEVNMGMMQLMLRQHPDLLDALRVPDRTADEARLRAEKRLRDLVKQLDAISIPTDRTQAELTTDLAHYTGLAATRPLTPVESSEMREVQKQIRKFTDYAAAYSAILPQIAAASAPAFTPTVAIPAGAVPSLSPQILAGELVTHLGRIMDEPVKAATAAAPQTPIGLEAVLRVYERFYQKHFTVPDPAIPGARMLVPMDVNSARQRAFGLYFKNEKTSENTHAIDHTVEHLAGKGLNPAEARIAGTKAFFKRFGSSGSDEAKILNIAESVGVRTGAGNVPANSNAMHILKDSGWLAGGAIAGTALLGPVVGTIAGVSAAVGADLVRRFWPGTRVLGIARYRATPNWGQISDQPEALTAALANITQGIKEGRISNTAYVQEQMNIIYHMLMHETHQGLAEGLAPMELSAESLKALRIENIRSATLKDIRAVSEGLLHPGASANQKHLTHAASDASKKVGAKRRAVTNPIKDWLNRRD